MQKEITEESLQSIYAGDYSFRMTDYISDGFKLLQQNIGGFIGFSLLYFVIVSIIGQLEQNLTGVQTSFISYIINALWLPGFYIVASLMVQKKDYSFNNFFDGHKQAGKLIGVYLLMTIITLIPITPGIVSIVYTDGIFEELELMKEAAENEELYFPEISMQSIILLIVGFVLMLYLQISYVWALPLATLTNLGVWQSLELSRKVVARKFFTYMGFVFLIGIVNMVGLMLLFIGIIATFPATMCATYLAFDDVFNISKGEQEDDLTEHFVV